MYDEDTIAAVSTPPGEGGVGIVRLSGPRAIEIAAKLFTSSTGRDPRHEKQRVFHGRVHDAQGRTLDEVLLHVMRAPHSYTREDVVEINAHGGLLPVAAILDEVLKQGARLARPGEFTFRAFQNGRIDLVQAEAVIDQIRARTQAGLQAANAAASGVLSTTLYALRDTLADALARIEAAIDFPEEDLPELLNEELIARVRAAHTDMLRLLRGAELGRLLREGASIAIAGRPNVGKSSLFNALLRDARAIVSAQPGTTRDRIEEYITIAGVPVRLMDTAGLRATEDEVEQIGVEIARSRPCAARIWPCWCSMPPSPFPRRIMRWPLNWANWISPSCWYSTNPTCNRAPSPRTGPPIAPPRPSSPRAPEMAFTNWRTPWGACSWAV